MTDLDADLIRFLEESNRIEGIAGVAADEIAAAQRLLGLPALTVADVTDFVRTINPDAVIRERYGLDVRVAGHVAPPGGPDIAKTLAALLRIIVLGKYQGRTYTPFEGHVAYERLHPFTDGNGRSGRLVWLWHMNRHHNGAPLGFLHTFYYQTLAVGVE